MTTEVLERLQKLSPQQRELVLKQLRAKQAGEAKPAAVGIVPVPKAAKIPLSFSQSRLWFLYQQMDEKNAAYNVPLFWQLKGNLDQVALEQSLSALMQRHEILRTCFRVVDDEAVQVIQPVSAWVLPVRDLRHLPASERLGEAQRLANADMETHFDLETAPLMRAQLLRLDEDWHVLLLVMHHIIVDGWSMGIFTDELAMCYQAFRQQQSPVLPPLKLQYADYAHWQRQWLGGEHLDKQLAYWKRQLENVPDLLQLPTDRPRPAVMTYVGSSEFLTLDAATTAGLQQLSREAGCTLFMTLLAAFNVLLARYSRQDDICIGSPIANRHRREIEPLIGFFANTLVFRSRLDMQASFRNLLQQVKQMTLDAYAHQDMPFEKLVEELKPKRSLSYNPLFQVMFIMQNMPGMNASLPGLQVETLEFDNQATQFDLSLTIKEHEQQLQTEWEFNTDLFDIGTIRCMQQHFQVLLQAFIDKPDQPLLGLPMLTDAEQQQLQVWNQTATDYPQDQTIVSLFEAQVARTPDNTAVVFENQTLTYRELNARANQVVHTLIAQGVQAGTLVGICMERSLEMVIGLLAILKAGGAYVPLDPAYPPERLAFMLEDSQLSVLLTQAHLADGLPLAGLSTAPALLWLDDHSLYAADQDSNPAPRNNPDNLAYVIYTSGSTGKPKGVQLTHVGLYNLTEDHISQYCIQARHRILQFVSISFDVATADIFMALCAGATLCLPHSASNLIEEGIIRGLRKMAITHVQLPASVLAALPHEIELPALEVLVSGGEAPSSSVIQYWSGQCKFFNAYGPTEATVCATMTACNANSKSTYIGQPIANTRIYLLDQHLQPLPPGIPGELCIAGAGLARGYLNRPELTAEKFITVELFGRVERLYRTGDLARWLPDGSLEYLGRIDQQVKLRGFRIELGEIEAVLAQHPAVGAVAVVLHERDGNKSLAAYVVPATVEDVTAVAGTGDRLAHLDTTSVRGWLAGQLPDYMVPTFFTVLECLPLTPNGKVDRKALPEPDLLTAGAGVSVGVALLHTSSEQLLAALWSGVLKLDGATLSADANFFALGGHSLLATQLASRVREAFAVELPLRVVFAEPTLRAMATWLDAQQRGVALPAITRLPAVVVPPLAFAQQRLWFLSQLEGESATYNMAVALRLGGRLDEAALRHALTLLVRRHAVLRQCFPSVEGAAVVCLLPAYDPLQITDLRHLTAEEQPAAVQRLADADASTPFDLAHGPLWRVQLLSLAEHSQVLLFNMHHIISDGWSMAVLLREWAALYCAVQAGELPPAGSAADAALDASGTLAGLPALPVQYGDYAAWQQQWLQGEVLANQRYYWTAQLAGAPALLELPTDFPRPAVQDYRGAHLQTTLGDALLQQAQQFSQAQGCTLYMTLLAAFQTLLARYSGQDDLCVGSPIANRTHAQTEGVVGMFVNTLVLRAQLHGGMTVRELLQQVRHTALGAYAHQDIPFEQLVEQLNPTRSLSHSPLFQVMLVLQNNEAVNLELPNLTVEPLEAAYPIAKFDLTLSLQETPEGLACYWEYATALFREASIARLADNFAVLLQAMLANADAPLHSLPLLTPAEQQQLQVWNQTATDYPQDQTIVSLFEAQVARTPDNTAVVFENQTLTYRELNAQANQVAHTLITQGVEADTLVGICMERSLEMVIGLLAILKSGGAYVPLDPSYPEERLRYMLSDCGAKLLLTQSGLQDKLAGLMAGEEGNVSSCELLCLDTTDFSHCPTRNLPLQAQPADLAYVIYTSGSTGKPKGVCLPHHGLSNYLHWARDYYAVKQGIGAPVQSSLSFDATITSLYLPLLSSRTTYLIPEKQEIEMLAELIQHQASFSLLKITPSHLEVLNQQLPTQILHDRVHVLVLGGEALKSKHLRPWLGYAPNTRLVNEYGPTEATVGCVVFDAVGHINLQGDVLIGKPIANTRIHILDAQQQPVPPGIPGELCIAGAGLARGYLNRPALTAEKFIEVELFGQVERVYRTGDLARWLPDGNLEYLGRIDHQVKLRGFRIELGEVEAVLAQHPGVREAVVVLHGQEGNQSLAAYAVLATETDGTADTTYLRQWLQSRLPDYMVPGSIMLLEHLPLTPNGKADRKALPAPYMNFSHASREVIAPRTALELQLLQIWEGVLQVRNIGVNDNFFEVGGNSLLALSLVSQIERKLGKRIPLTLLFQGGTIVHQAEFWQQSYAPDAWSTLVPLKSTGNKTPLFFVHPGAGTVIWYRYLAHHLSSGQPLYGLESQGLEEGHDPFDRVEAMAAYYIKAIKTLQPEGPYLIAGWCFGGVVAFEMAQQLTRNSEKVAFLGMLDSPVSATLPQEYASEVLFFIRLLQRDVPHLPEFHAEIAHLDEDIQLQQLLEQVKQVGQLPADFELEQTRRMLAVFRGHLIAASVYKPQPYAGKVHFFQAGDGEARQWDDPTMGWSAFAADRQVEWIPGDHMTMVTDPNVQFLAEKLEQYFARIMP